MKNLIENAISSGYNFAYGTGNTTLTEALGNNQVAAKREQAEVYVMNEYKTHNPSSTTGFDTLFNNGSVWIWDLSEELAEHMSVEKFASHPGLNKSWLAEQLWGSSEGKNRTKIALRLSGKRSWQPEELEKLKLIKEQFISEI